MITKGNVDGLFDDFKSLKNKFMLHGHFILGRLSCLYTDTDTLGHAPDTRVQEYPIFYLFFNSRTRPGHVQDTYRTRSGHVLDTKIIR